LTNDALAFILPSTVQLCSQWNKDALTIAGTGTSGDSLSELSSPHQIAMDRSGKLYIYDTDNERIQIVDNGSVYTWRHSDRKLQGDCLFIDDDGTLYIETGSGKPIIQWTNDGVLTTTKCQPSGCTDMFVDSITNDIYITESANHRVIKCTPDGTQTVVAGITKNRGNSLDKLFYPRGLFVDEENKDIFVADATNGRIQKWSQNAEEGITVHNISAPNTLIKDKNDLFYVGLQDGRIIRLKPYEQKIETIIGVKGNSSHYLLNTI
jgi:sugar lactone lactonase YvrE